ncbi:hypothetical protein EGM51_16750 [Verrucomicrobia bacterium S94]|nr:hypothetical protein EGM51_16750 [Verrucomicrobia bacterium S94]
MNRQWFLTGSIIAAGSSVLGQRVIDITGTGQGKIPISLAAYRTGSDAASRGFLAVLKADLNRSGYFRVTSSGAAVSVVGQVRAGSQMKADVQVYKVAGRQRMLGKSYNAPANSYRTLAHKAADEILYAVTGKKGMASAKIALVGTHTGRKELYIADIDGKGLRQVTKDRSIVVAPRWSPDGSAVIYTSYKRGYPNVFMTGRSRPISKHPGLNAMGTLSPDGRTLAVILSKDGNPDLYLKSMLTGLTKRITRTRRGNEASPCWSPDGNHLVYVSDSSGRPHIYIVSRNGGTPKRISSSGTENISPDWGENGLITWCSRIGGKYRIVVGNPVKRTSRVLETDWADYEDPRWAPDGRHIVCSRTSGYRSGIYLLDTLKDSPVALISGSGDWYSPAVSP